MADVKTLGILEEIEAIVSDKLQVVITKIDSLLGFVSDFLYLIF